MAAESGSNAETKVFCFFSSEKKTFPLTRPILSAGLATAVAVSILIGLGIWQIKRLHWKQGLLAQIDAAEQASPVELAATTPPLFTRVVVHGVLRGDRIALYGAEVRGAHLGAQAIEVLDRVGAKPVLVDLGWVPADHFRPAPASGPRDITGYVRLPETPNFLSAPDDVEGLRFYTLNPATIGAALGAPDAAPFTLVALKNPLAVPLPAGAPEPADSLPRPPNNHLQYALTWFGLAAALLGVFASWVFKAVPALSATKSEQ
jgi:surfeit locus 1 family protein